MGLSQYRENLGPVELLQVPKVKPVLPGPLPEPRPIGLPAPPPVPIQPEGGAVRVGTGAPYSDLGQDGDFYINGSTGDIYKKQMGAYTITGSARSGTVGGGAQGPQGIQGPPGADGPAGPPGSDGGSIDLVNFASLPAASTDGLVYYFNDTSYVARDNGASYDYFYQGSKATLLDDSGWSWFNQGSATRNTGGGMVQLLTPTAAGTQLRGRLRGSYPTPPFTLTTIIQPRFQFAAGSNGLGIFGITVTDGTKHKIFVAASFNFNTANPPDGLWVGKYNSVTAAVSATVYDSIQPAGSGVPVWLRLEDNNTNQIFSFSFDGVFFTTVLSEARTTHLTPSDLGLVLTNQSGSQEVGGNVLSWRIV